MNYRIGAVSLLFIFCAACGSKTSSQLCGTNQEIMSNVASTCAGVVGGASSNGTNTNNGQNNNGQNNNGQNNNGQNNNGQNNNGQNNNGQNNNGQNNNGQNNSGTNNGQNNNGQNNNGTNNGQNNNGSNPSAANQGGNATFNFANYVGNGRWNPFDVTGNSNGWNSNFQAEIDEYLRNGGEVPPQYHIPIIAAGAGKGGGPRVQIRVVDTNQIIFDQFVYNENFNGGVRVALCDINNDGTADLVTAPGPGGGPHVRVFDGRSGAVIGNFYAYDQIVASGVYVACADLNGDRHADIVTTAGQGGGPHVKVFSGVDPSGGQLLANSWAPGFDSNTYDGLTVATGDIDGALDENGKRSPEILIGQETGGSDYVVVKLQSNGTLGVVYPRTSSGLGDGGINVAAGDVNADGKADLIFGKKGVRSIVVIRSGANPQLVLASFNAYEDNPVGSFVASSFLKRGGNADIITGADFGGGPHVKAYQFQGFALFFNQMFFDEATALAFRGGLSVAGGLAF